MYCVKQLEHPPVFSKFFNSIRIDTAKHFAASIFFDEDFLLCRVNVVAIEVNT
jgi:hypothetical protein